MGKKKTNTNDTIVNKLPLVMKSGKYSFGYKESIRALRNKAAKIVIVANNYPQVEKSELQYYCMLTNTIFYEFPGTNIDLGRSCGKYFKTSVLTIKDVGESDIISFLTEQK